LTRRDRHAVSPAARWDQLRQAGALDVPGDEGLIAELTAMLDA